MLGDAVDGTYLSMLGLARMIAGGLRGGCGTLLQTNDSIQGYDSAVECTVKFLFNTRNLIRRSHALQDA
jgi:hypothetical protein